MSCDNCNGDKKLTARQVASLSVMQAQVNLLERLGMQIAGQLQTIRGQLTAFTEGLGVKMPIELNIDEMTLICHTEPKDALEEREAEKVDVGEQA